MKYLIVAALFAGAISHTEAIKINQLGRGDDVLPPVKAIQPSIRKGDPEDKNDGEPFRLPVNREGEAAISINKDAKDLMDT